MIAIGTNALASSIVLALRPRPDVGRHDRPAGLRRGAAATSCRTRCASLQQAHIAPVDLPQAAIGPGMAVFSRYAKVIEPDGSTMRVRTALALINEILDEVLERAGGRLRRRDPLGRSHWFSQHFGDDGPFGVAEHSPWR